VPKPDEEPPCPSPFDPLKLGCNLSPPFVYCDHNFVLTSHDADEKYQDHLRQLVSDEKVKFVLSTWHWLEMARDTNHARGLSVAAFADSLRPAWLFERLTIQQREVEDAFFRVLGIPHQRLPRLGSLAEVLADLNRVSTAITSSYRDSRAFVKHMQTLGDNHQMNASLRSNFEAQKSNGENYRAGRLTPEMIRCLDKIMIGRFLPMTTPNGRKIVTIEKDMFLRSCKNEDFASIAVESGLSLDGWQTGRLLTDRAFRDSQHVIALPYVDLFVTDDEPLTKAIRRVVAPFAFRTAEVIDKVEFDKRFP
jgi:hypothetical protein